MTLYEKTFRSDELVSVGDINILDEKFQKNPSHLIDELIKHSEAINKEFNDFISSIIAITRYSFKKPEYSDGLRKAALDYGIQFHEISEEDWNNRVVL